MADQFDFAKLADEGWSVDPQVPGRDKIDKSIRLRFYQALPAASLYAQLPVVTLQAVCRQLDLEAAAPSDASSLRSALLNIDLKQIGVPALPDDINRCDSKRLAGPHILQLVSAVDVAQPQLFQDAPSDRKGRLLRLKLTDGHRSCVGVEYLPLGSLRSPDLVPGVKVLIRGVLIRVGVLLLEPKCIELVGGRVQALAEAWEVQQKYGGTAERTAAAEGAAGERPRPFQPFVPGKATPAVLGAGSGSAAQPLTHRESGKNGRGGRATAGPGSKRGGHSASGNTLPPPPPAPAPPPPQPARTEATAAPEPVYAARQKLLERLAANGDQGRGRGMGRFGGGRRGRRGRWDDDDDGAEGSMTLEEWEAQQAAAKGSAMTKSAGAGEGAAPPVHVVSDEELARQLQRQLDMEDAQAGLGPGTHGGGGDVTDLRSSLMGMFSYGGGEEGEGGDEYGRGTGGRRGRGRGRGRGGARGRGRSRGR